MGRFTPSWTLLLVLALGCDPAATDPASHSDPDGSDVDPGSVDSAAGDGDDLLPSGPPEATVVRFATEVIDFSPGPGSGFGSEFFPDVVLGPPVGGGEIAGGLDVLSLGQGGVITLGFGGGSIVDGPGPDLVVYENPFWPGGNAASVFAELGSVAVSPDLETWYGFDCLAEPTEGQPGLFAGCSGWTPVLACDAETELPADPFACGGEAYDLADLGVDSIRYVRIVDVSWSGSEPSAGFDLDAVAAVHAVD